MRFVAIDVETANPNCASICQVGVALFEDGELIDTWSSLVDPEDYFDPVNVSIHGITEADVAGEPPFPRVYPDLSNVLRGNTVVHHTHFDRTALTRAARRYRLSPLEAAWLDSAKVVRRAWPEFAQSGYGLSNVASTLGVSFNHHGALEDAIACGRILVHAIEHSGLSIADWIDRVQQPIGGTSYTDSIRREGAADGPLAGERVVFTGKLSMPRREAADLAAAAGASVSNSVTQDTTLLVVGVQDLRRTKGRKKSSKHRKAERLIREGYPISIVSEEDFLWMVEPVHHGPDSA